MWLNLIWENKRIIGELIGVILVAFVIWWFFIHNVMVIDDLEKDKAELSRQIEARKQSLQLLDDIQQGKVRINAQVQTQISTVRAAAIPRRTIIIKPGGMLPALPAANASH